MNQKQNYFMQSIDWINQMCDLITKHGVWKLLMSMLFLGVIAGGIWAVANSRDILQHISETQVDIDKTRHAELLQYRMEIEPKIDKLLQVTMDSLKADRIFILEPHNGTSTLNGIPFWYLNMSFERTHENMAAVKRFYKDIEANEFPLAYRVFIEHEWAGTIEELSKIDSKLAKFMKVNDAEYMKVVSMMGTDTFLGFVGITYTNLENVPEEIKRRSVLHSAVQRITIYLDGYDKRHSR